MFKCFGKGHLKNQTNSNICIDCRDIKEIIVGLRSRNQSMECPHCGMKYYGTPKNH